MKFSTVALLVLSTAQQADAFVVKPTSAPRESLALNALPTKIKKGEKVKTAVDFGGLVSSLVRYRTLSGSNQAYHICCVLTSPLFYSSRVSWVRVSVLWDSLWAVHKMMGCQL